jgi:hypothetical protein
LVEVPVLSVEAALADNDVSNELPAIPTAPAIRTVPGKISFFPIFMIPP